MIDYNLKPQDYMKMEVKAMSQEDLKELAYFLWCFYGDTEEDLMSWRKDNLIPLIKNQTLSMVDLEND